MVIFAQTFASVSMLDVISGFCVMAMVKDFLKDNQIIMSSVVWVLLVVSFTYTSLLFSLFGAEISFEQEYSKFLSSRASFFVHWGCVVMLLYDHDCGSSNGGLDYSSFSMVVLCLCVLPVLSILMCFLAELSPGALVPEFLHSHSFLGVIHLLFWFVVASLSYRLECLSLPLVQPV